MKILAITCTGGRPDAWALCQNYMHRQTRRPDHWLVLDDCDPQTAFVDGVVRPSWRWKPKTENTIRKNLLHALRQSLLVDFDVCFLMEDDDWYAPEYIERLAPAAMENRGMVGLKHSYDYNVRFRGFRENKNDGHCTGASTAWHRDATASLLEAIQNNNVPTLDRFMWRKTPDVPKAKFARHDFVGIKGMPGRGGTVRTHRQEHLVNPDPDMEKLKEWIGEDWRNYERFYTPPRDLS